MGIIYNKRTATCLLEFQAAYRQHDLSPSIFTFQLWLNKHDKYTHTHTHTGLILILPSLPPLRCTDFMQKSSGALRRLTVRMSVLQITGACRSGSVCVCVCVCVCVRVRGWQTERGTEIVTPGSAATALRRRVGIQTYLHVPRPEPRLTSQQLLIMNWPAEKSTELWICKTRRSGQGLSNTHQLPPCARWDRACRKHQALLS